MKIDDLISRVARDLAGAKEPIKQAILANYLSMLQQAVAIRVNTGAEARLMFDVYRQSLASFPYPFGDHFCWVEISERPGSPLCYMLMPPDSKYPHWQVYLNPSPPFAEGFFAWSPDGRIGPYQDRPGGFPCGPTLFVDQDRNRCRGCNYLDAEGDDELVLDFVSTDGWRPAWEKALSRHKVCRFVHGPDISRCPRSADAWDVTLLPISIILYIALAPDRELDAIWRPPRILGHGKTRRRKVGYYHVTPIRKHYFHRRVTAYSTGQQRSIDKRFFVRGHIRSSHFRRCRDGTPAKVREHWVRLYWKGPEELAAAPHRYTIDWPADARVDVARRLTKGDSDERRRRDSWHGPDS